MKVMFFVQVRDFTGCEQAEIELKLPVAADGLWELLEAKFPGIAKFRSSTRLARNFAYAREDQIFSNEDEVALLSPVSGG